MLEDLVDLVTGLVHDLVHLALGFRIRPQFPDPLLGPKAHVPGVLIVFVPSSPACIKAGQPVTFGAVVGNGGEETLNLLAATHLALKLR